MYYPKRCESCKYSSKLNEGSVCCVYILVEKRRRGCYGSRNCKKYIEREMERRPKISLEGGIYYVE